MQNQRIASRLVIRLERNNRELIHLRNTLRSYLCEPKTPGLFERYEKLKRQLEDLYNENMQVIKDFRAHQEEFALDGCREQLMAYEELERRILEYIGMAKMHG